MGWDSGLKTTDQVGRAAATEVGACCQCCR